MPYGWMGTDLEVNLSQGRIEKRQGDPKSVETYLTGKGINAKLLWDRVPPEVDAFSPDSLFIIGAGILIGTIVPGANHTCITYKSPVTNIQSYSTLGGFFAAELKRAGYDTIIISGKSPMPVYLSINNDQVELRDATHLWGKDPRETQRIIREELKSSSVQIMCIGLAGENKVYHATVEHGTGASASSGGTGTIMGDKKLKAIAVYGTKDVAIAETAKLVPLCEHILSRTGETRTRILEPWGYAFVRAPLQFGDFGNFSGVVSPELQQEIKAMGRKAQDFMTRTRTREVACSNCGMRCRHVYSHPDDGYTFLKCGNLGQIMVATQVLDCDFAVSFMHLCQKYGLDSHATGNCISFAIDLYEKGILTKEDTDGLHLKWKSPEVAFALIEKIAHRQGIGDVLADGTYRAARRIGKGAEDYAIHSKKLELAPWRIFHENHGALMAALSEKGDIAKLDSGVPSLIIRRPKEEREAYLKAGWFPYPKEFEKYLLAGTDPGGAGAADYRGDCLFIAYDMEQYTLADATGLCIFWLQFWLYPTISSRAQIADLVSYVTGMDIDETEATKIARRIVNLLRAYDVREGVRRKDDGVPSFAFERTPPAPQVKFDVGMFNKMIDTYYEIRGWNSDGIPTKETLGELGLDYVTEDLEQRGILDG